jgi:UDP-3-O-[3-hydroxymyristoyl] glucosamine N-acyltransferase
MQFKISDIASLIGGKIEGDGNLLLSSVGKIESAKEGDISFLSNPKYESYIYDTNATAVLVSNTFEPKKSVKTTLIKVDDPYSSFTAILTEYSKLKTTNKIGIENPSYLHESIEQKEGLYLGRFAYVSEKCTIGHNVKIFPNAYIGSGVTIGDDCIIHPGVKIYSNTIIGNNCNIQANAVIGSDGFGFAPQDNGEYKPIPQIGNVIIEDNVSIGANCVVDCGTMGSTLIEKGTKIDNLVQVAHNVEIGKNNVIAAQAGISGSAKIGNNCMIGGQVGIAGHIFVANRTNVGAQAGILTPPKKEGESIWGSPSINIKDYMKSYVVFKKLPTLSQEISKLKEKILSLESNREK